MTQNNHHFAHIFAAVGSLTHFFVLLTLSRSYVWAVHKLRYRDTIAIDAFVAIFMRTRTGTGSACLFLVE